MSQLGEATVSCRVLGMLPHKHPATHRTARHPHQELSSPEWPQGCSWQHSLRGLNFIQTPPKAAEVLQSGSGATGSPQYFRNFPEEGSMEKLMPCSRWLGYEEVLFPHKHSAIILKKVKSADYKEGFHKLLTVSLRPLFPSMAGQNGKGKR